MASANWVTPGGAAPDQITAEHILASHPPPNVKDGPVSTIWHWQVASAGSRGSISQGMSTQLAQGALSGQESTPNALVTFCVEKVETSFVPVRVRSSQEVYPIE